MAVTQKEMIYEISVDTKNAVTSIQDVNRVLSNLTDVLATQVVPGITKTSDSMSGWRAQAIAINQAVELMTKAWSMMSDPINKALTAFEEQDKVMNKLSATLQIVGEKDIDGMIKSYAEFSTAMQNSTVYGDEQVQNLIAIGRAARIPNDMLLTMIKTSGDLSAATGDSLEGAFSKLQSSLKGQGRMLAEYNKDILKLTEDELRNGEAIKILSGLYDGFASKDAKSFGGQVKQLNNLIGDLWEEIGKLIFQVFGLGDAIASKIELIKNVIPLVDRLTKALIALKDVIPAVIAAMAALGVALIIIKWSTFISAINTITLSLYLWATAASSTAASMALLTAQVTLVSAGVLTIASAIEQIIKNFDQFKEKISGLGFLKGVKEALIDWDFGTAGKSINAIGNSIAALTGKTKEQAKATDESADATKRSSTAMDKLAGRDFQDAIKERKAAMQGLSDMIDSLSAKQIESGGSEVDRINAQTMAQQKGLAKKIEEAKLVKSINRTELERISIQASQLIEDIKRSSIKDVQKKQLDELIKSNQDLEMSVGSAFQTQYDQSRKILAIENEKLDIKEAQLKAQGLMTEQLQSEIDKARLLVKEKANKSGSPETKTYQTMVSAGAKAATAISGVFTKGATGMMTGAMNIVTMIIQAIMSIADIIPSFLSGLSDAFNKLADLPSVIMSLIPKLGEAVLRFTQEFLPQFLKMLPDMIMTGIEYFLDKIPEASNAIMDALPELIDKLLEKLPNIVQTLIETSLKSTGSTIAALLKLVIMLITRTLPNLIKTIIKDMIPALINGIVNGISEAGKSFGKILNMGNIGKVMSGALGKGVKIDSKGFDLNLAKSFKQASATLTGEASKIFAVQDLTDTMKALSPAEDMANKVEDGLKKGTDYLKMWWLKLLQYLKDVWMWVWNLIKPVFDALKQIWDMVISLLQTLWNNLQVLWDNVILALQALWDTLKSVWDMVITALQSLWDSLDAIWKGVWTKLSEVWEKLKSVGSDIWDGLTDAIKKAPETFSKLGSSIWKGLSDGLKNASTGLLSIFNKLDPSNLFKKMFKVDMGGTGTVEKALGIDIPFMAFAKGGEVPGNAPVSGDSSMNDRILALVSPGEAIIPRSKMNKPEVKSIVDAILTGKFSPQSYFKGSMKIGGHQIGISENGIEVDEVVVAPINPIKAIEDSTEQMWEMVKDKTFGMVMKMFESNKFHNGGLVPSFANGGEVPAMLQSGEFVVNRRATSSLGANFLDRINGQSSSGAKMQQPIINLTIDIKTTEPIDDAFFRQKVLPRVRDEIKRSSLNGEFVISAKGIR